MKNILLKRIKTIRRKTDFKFLSIYLLEINEDKLTIYRQAMENQDMKSLRLK